MSLLHLAEPGLLRCHGSMLRWAPASGSKGQEWPLANIRRLVVNAEVTLHASSLATLQRERVELVLDNGQPMASSLPGDPQLRIRQALAWQHPEIALEGARRLLLLRLQHDADLHPGIAHWLCRIGEQIKQSKDMRQLRALESLASRLVFRAWRQYLPASWGFRKRLRRPPPDPFNALLSLTAILLASEFSACVVNHGLDPGIGVLHVPDPRRGALIWDLLEPWRPLAQAWLAEMMQQGQLVPGLFSQSDNGCRLTPDGWQVFMPAWQRWRSQHYQAMQQTVMNHIHWLARQSPVCRKESTS